MFSHSSWAVRLNQPQIQYVKSVCSLLFPCFQWALNLLQYKAFLFRRIGDSKLPLVCESTLSGQFLKHICLLMQTACPLRTAIHVTEYMQHTGSRGSVTVWLSIIIPKTDNLKHGVIAGAWCGASGISESTTFLAFSSSTVSLQRTAP